MSKWKCKSCNLHCILKDNIDEDILEEQGILTRAKPTECPFDVDKETEFVKID